jgi:hypothetical protein
VSRFLTNVTFYRALQAAGFELPSKDVLRYSLHTGKDHSDLVTIECEIAVKINDDFVIDPVEQSVQTVTRRYRLHEITAASSIEERIDEQADAALVEIADAADKARYDLGLYVGQRCYAALRRNC